MQQTGCWPKSVTIPEVTCITKKLNQLKAMPAPSNSECFMHEHCSQSEALDHIDYIVVEHEESNETWLL
jgi:hypothetical protein